MHRTGPAKADSTRDFAACKAGAPHTSHLSRGAQGVSVCRRSLAQRSKLRGKLEHLIRQRKARPAAAAAAGHPDIPGHLVVQRALPGASSHQRQRNGQQQTKHTDLCQGKVSVILSATPVVLLGTGSDAIPLARRSRTTAAARRRYLRRRAGPSPPPSSNNAMIIHHDPELRLQHFSSWWSVGVVRPPRRQF